MYKTPTYSHRESDSVEHNQSENEVLEGARSDDLPRHHLHWRVLGNVATNRVRRQGEFHTLALHSIQNKLINQTYLNQATNWRRGSVVKTTVFGRRTFPDLCLFYG